MSSPCLPCRGASQSGNTSDAMALLEQLKQRRVQLQQEERKLEELHGRMQQCLRNITQDSDEERYPQVVTSIVYFRGLKPDLHGGLGL